MNITSIQFLCPIRINVISDSGEELSYNGNVDFVNQTVDGVSEELATAVMTHLNKNVSSSGFQIPDASSRFRIIRDAVGSRVKNFVENVDAKSEYKSSKHSELESET